MKKLLFILTIAFTPLFTIAGDFKIGIQFDPNLSLSRLEHTNADEYFNDIDNVGDLAAKINMALVADIPLLDHVDLEIGAGWGNNSIGFDLNYVADTTASFSTQNLKFNLQYLNIPIGLKLYTNDITNTMKVYVSVGSKLALRLDETQKEDLGEYEDYVSDENFSKWFDSSLRLGAGVEIKVGTSNVAFLGLEYERGLVNVVSKDYLNIQGATLDKESLKAYNDQIKLVLGFKF